MDSKKINQLATNVAPSIYDLTVVGDSTTGELKKITLNQIASLFGSVGGVSSVAMTVPTGLSISGSPITTSGTLALSLSSGYSIPTTAKQAEWDLGYSERLKWDGGSVGLDAPTARTSLGLVIGTNVLAYRTFGTAANNNTGDFATAAQGANADTAYNLRLTGASLPLSISGNVISIAQSTNLISGYLSSTDWNTFNNKQAALNGTGLVKSTSGTITYITDNSSNWNTAYSWGNPNGVYLPLTGGTLTGALNGTNASFSSSVTATQFIIGADQQYKMNGSNSGYAYITSNVGFNSNYNGTAIISNPTNANSLSAWTLDLGGNDGINNEADGFTILRKPNGGSYSRLFTIASTGAATFSKNILVNDSFGLVNIASTSTGFFPTSSLTLLLKSNGSTALTINSNLTATFSSTIDATRFISNVTNNYGVVLNRTAVTTYNGMSLQTAGTAKWFLGMRENLSSNNYIIYSEQIATDVLKLDVSTGAATFSSSVTATSFVKTSGTSSQFLKADGSVDSSTYLTTSSASSTYLPLTGGILTGSLNGTSASFSGSINNLGLNTSPTSVGTSANYFEFRNTGGDFYLGQEGSLAGGFFTGSSAYASVLYSATSQEFIIGGIRRLQISSTGTTIFEDSSINIGTIYNYSTLNILASSSPALTITDGYNGKFTFIPYENSTNGHLIKSKNYADNTYYPLTLEASRVQTPNGSLVVGGTNDNGYAFYVNGAGKFTGDLTSTTIKTAAPSGSTAQPWKLGDIDTTVCPIFASGYLTTTYITVEINGNTYAIPTVSPNYC